MIMRRASWLVLTLAAGLALGLSACGDDDDDSETADEEQATETEATEEPAAEEPVEDSEAAGGEVSIEGFAFVPADLQVSVGDTVTWTNLDPTSHTVTDDSGAFDSGSVSGDGTFELTFDTAGEFAYHCDFHPGMTGTVTVADASSGAQPDDTGSQPISLGDGY